MENCIKLRINAGDKNTSNPQDKTIADAYGNKFIIPLDFEMLPLQKTGIHFVYMLYTFFVHYVWDVQILYA